MQLVKKAEELLFSVDSTIQILNINVEGDQVVIETNSRHLVEKIGKSLCSACGGELSEDKSKSSSELPQLIWSR